MVLSFRKIAKRTGCSDMADLFASKSLIRSDQRLIVDVERWLCAVFFLELRQSSDTFPETVESCSGIFDGLLDDVASDFFEPGILFTF